MNDDSFDLIAKHYDLLYADREDDLDMWLELTAEVQSPILEVGCGTGRVMLPLLQHDRRVTGIDISEIALQAAQAKLVAGGFTDRASLHLADMRTLDLPEKDFSFAFVPINTFMHCQTLVDQQAALNNLYQHLQPGATLVIDMFHPAPHLLLEADKQLLLENQIIDDLTNHTIQWFISRHLHLEEQKQVVTFLLDEITEDGTIVRDTITFSLRYVHRFEMELLLQAANFYIEEVLGDYDLSPFSGDSPRMIFIAKKTS